MIIQQIWLFQQILIQQHMTQLYGHMNFLVANI